jgi:hypothetical protein
MWILHLGIKFTFIIAHNPYEIAICDEYLFKKFPQDIQLMVMNPFPPLQ